MKFILRLLAGGGLVIHDLLNEAAMRRGLRGRFE